MFASFVTTVGHPVILDLASKVLAGFGDSVGIRTCQKLNMVY